MTFEEFYDNLVVEYKQKNKRMVPGWVIEDMYDAKYYGYRRHDPDRWRFLSSRRKKNEPTVPAGKKGKTVTLPTPGTGDLTIIPPSIPDSISVIKSSLVYPDSYTVAPVDKYLDELKKKFASVCITDITLKWIGDTLHNLSDFNNVSHHVYLEVDVQKTAYNDGSGYFTINGRTFDFGAIYYQVKLDDGEHVLYQGVFEVDGEIDDLCKSGFNGKFNVISKQ